MISIPTTLVLGAGASMPYGFPSGAALREKLCDVNFMNELTRHGDFSDYEVRGFCDIFLQSGMASIDAFLARRGDHPVVVGGRTFSEVGKAGIALALISCEKAYSFFDFRVEDNWYQYLWQILGDSLEGIGLNKLSIITFNYDRSLEAYLLTSIKNSFGVSEDQAAEQLKKIPIVHVYGKIGELGCLASSGEGCREYIHNPVPNDISVGAQGIRVIAEHRDNSPEFARAHELLRAAQRICFLGFGFDAINVKRLNISEILKERFETSGFSEPHVFSTSLGMLKSERERIVRLLTASNQPISSAAPGFYRYDSLRTAIENNIAQAASYKNLEYLRHTGVLYGLE